MGLSVVYSTPLLRCADYLPVFKPRMYQLAVAAILLKRRRYCFDEKAVALRAPVFLHRAHIGTFDESSFGLAASCASSFSFFRRLAS